jgi:sialidase-1
LQVQVLPGAPLKIKDETQFPVFQPESIENEFMKWVVVWSIFVTRALCGFAANINGYPQTDIFMSGQGGYHTYRIPAIVVATNGAVLAFCEGRKVGAEDSGNIDLLLKRSLDDGATWGTMEVVRDGAGNVCGNPAPVVDQITGEIFLLTTWNRGADTEKMILNGTSADTRRVFVQSTRDNGATWSAAREITGAVKRLHWRWYATGPCNGIQFTMGAHKGRLLIPANHSDHSDPAKHPYRSHVIYSDDHGASWKLGGIEDEKTNESTLVELSDGRVLQNMRSYHGKNCRALAFSNDGGLSFGPVTLATNLVDSICQASMLRLRSGEILFANPASKKRENMTVRISNHDGKTWGRSTTIESGPSAYSCLAQLADGTVLCLYERGEKSPYEKITIARFQRGL